MAWDYAPSDPELLRGMKDAGMNMAGFCEAKDVEPVRAAGINPYSGREELFRGEQNWLASGRGVLLRVE
jgi:hypothetical protein